MNYGKVDSLGKRGSPTSPSWGHAARHVVSGVLVDLTLFLVQDKRTNILPAPSL